MTREGVKFLVALVVIAAVLIFVGMQLTSNVDLVKVAADVVSGMIIGWQAILGTVLMVVGAVILLVLVVVLGEIVLENFTKPKYK